MKPKIAYAGGILAMVLNASALTATTRPCSAALVTAGVCTSASDVLVFYSLSTVDPDGAGPRVSISMQVVEGCALYFNYQPTISGSPNPETKQAFCDRLLKSNFFPRLGSLYYGSLADAVRQTTINATPADSVP